MKFKIGDRVIVKNSNYAWLEGETGKIISFDGQFLYGVEFDIEDKQSLLHSCGGRGKANKCFWVADVYLKPFVGTKHPRVRRVVIEITDNGANAKYCVSRRVENAVSVHRYKEDAPDDGKAAVYAVAKLFGIDLNEMEKDEKSFSEMRDAWRKFKSVIEDAIFDDYTEE